MIAIKISIKNPFSKFLLARHQPGTAREEARRPLQWPQLSVSLGPQLSLQHAATPLAHLSSAQRMHMLHLVARLVTSGLRPGPLY